MEKFVKENLFKILILLIIIVGVCIYYFNYFLPQKRQMELLDLQAKCATQAQSFYTNKGYKNDDGYSYTNHFNSKLNKCFILVNYYTMNDDFLTIDLYDVLEGKHYAEFDGHNMCSAIALSLNYPPNPNKCRVDTGHIWLNGDDTKNPADFDFGALVTGKGNGEDTQKQFLEKVQPFMND